MAAQRMAAAAAWPFVAPMRAARRTAEAWRRWRRSFAAGLRVLPIVAAATLLSSRRRRALVDAWRPVQARIVWTSGMAVLAGLLVCLVAGGLRLAASAGVQAAVWPVQRTPALAAMVSGVAGLVVAGVFTDLARWPNRRVSGAMLRSAGLRAALAACGWVLGWAVALAVLGVTGATAGLSASPPGWSVTWAVYGAIGGIVGGAGQHGGSRQLYWAMAGAAFGTVGYAVTRLAAALLAGGR
jgi:hypothetical protein